MLRVDGIQKAFSDFELGPISFTVEVPTVVGLLGRNGAGKTTLLRSIFGLYPQDGTPVEIDGETVSHASSEGRQKIVYQTEELAIPRFLTAWTFGKLLSSFYRNWDSSGYKNLLHSFEVPEDKNVSDLSTGNSRKLSVAAALATRSEVVLMDEPTSNVDPICREAILNEVARYTKANHQVVVFSSHLVPDVLSIADRIMIMRDGMISYDEHVARDQLAQNTEETILQYMR